MLLPSCSLNDLKDWRYSKGEDGSYVISCSLNDLKDWRY